MKKLISVVVPAYNAERTIKRCLESILRQTYSNLEVLLINDGSIDSTEDICSLYSPCKSKTTILAYGN